VRKLKTPGGQLVFQYVQKKAAGPACGDCGKRLPGIPALRPTEYRQTKRRERKIARAYGGSRCSACVRQRIVRAFLIEEQKIVKHVLRQRDAKKPKAAAK